MRNRDKRKARKLKQQMKTLHLSPREAYLGQNWQPPAETRPHAQIEKQRMGEWK